jgi:hypothetical protein
MRPILGCMILAGILTVSGFAAGRGPEVLNVDDKISIQAEDVTLEQLVRLWDQATGMHSQVAPQLANRKLTVHFTALPVNDALRKMFEGEQFNYTLIEGQGVVVTPGLPPATAQAEVPPADNALPENQVAVPEAVPENVASDDAGQPLGPPVVPGLQKPTAVPPPEVRPTLVPTPFGPILNLSGLPPTVPPELPPVMSAPPPPFFAPQIPTMPPAGAANGPAQNVLFGPLPLYPDSRIPPPNQPLLPYRP